MLDTDSNRSKVFLKMYFEGSSYSYNIIHRGQTLCGDSARLPPISHQCVIYLCPSYDGVLTCTKIQITDFRFKTQYIGQVRSAFSYHI